MRRQVHVEAEIGADPLGEGLRRVRIAVDHEDPLRSSVACIRSAAPDERAHPGIELVLVGVRGEPGDRPHAASDRVRLVVDVGFRCPVLDGVPQRALALVADEEQRAAGIGQEVLQVVEMRPPVSMPDEATIMSGRGFVRIALEASTAFVYSSPGYSRGESPERRSADVSSSYVSGCRR